MRREPIGAALFCLLPLIGVLHSLLLRCCGLVRHVLRDTGESRSDVFVGESECPILAYTVFELHIDGDFCGFGFAGDVLLDVHTATPNGNDQVLKLEIAICFGHGVVVDLGIGCQTAHAWQLLSGFEISGSNEVGETIPKLHPDGQIGRFIYDEKARLFLSGQNGTGSFRAALLDAALSSVYPAYDHAVAQTETADKADDVGYGDGAAVFVHERVQLECERHEYAHADYADNGG